jgi:phage shock protein PspC (stress-responsive transcriptional regulator)
MDEAESGLPPWTRSREGRVIAGVCAGFARRLGTSPWIVRAVLIFATLVTFGLAAVVYAILAVTLPLANAEADGEDEDEVIDG